MNQHNLTDEEIDQMIQLLDIASDTMERVENEVFAPLFELVIELNKQGGEKAVIGDQIAAILEGFKKEDGDEVDAQ